MAHTYVPCDRDQLFLLPTSMREWLPEEHLAWSLIDVVGKVNTGAFHARHPNDGVGRPAYDPDTMLTLLMYAYCQGVRSSRRIEQLCESDIAYRVICANRGPDHATVAHFRVDHEQAIAGVFVDVLCAAAGLTSLGTIAIDGTKIGADAALDANRGAEAIRAEVERILAEGSDTDTAEAIRLGYRRGDELPAELASPFSRLARLERALAEIEEMERIAAAEAEARQAKATAAAAEGLGGRPAQGTPSGPGPCPGGDGRRPSAGRGQGGGSGCPGQRLRGRNPVLDPELERAAARLQAAEAAAAAAKPNAPQANTTDPDSRIMKTASGYVQGYNAQAAVNGEQIVVACAVTQEGNDCRQLVPMISATEATLEAAAVRENIGLILADASYWSEANAIAEGPDRLIATTKDWKQRRAARELGTTTGPPPKGATPLLAMEDRLRTAEGAEAYGKRSCTVEPTFGESKENRGFRRFMRRGLPAVQSEWSLINATHNLLKLYRHSSRGGNPAPVPPRPRYPRRAASASSGTPPGSPIPSSGVPIPTYA